MTHRFARAGIVSLVIVAAGAVAAEAAANAAGAPEGTAIDGCTCHAPEPAGSVSVTLDGLPAAYEPGEEYTLTVSVDGPDSLPAPLGQAQGGFQVAVDVGLLTPGDNMAKNVNETTVTHNTQGNDQREWFVVWAAPVGNEVRVATFWLAGNAVNGDNTNQNDAWNSAVVTVPPVGGNETTAPEEEPSGSAASSLPLVAAVGAVAAVAYFGRVRRS